MNRNDFQSLARLRLREARALLRVQSYPGAYYLAGYAVECALKACIARRTRRHDFPDRKVVSESYTHDLDKLVKVAGLGPALQAQMRGDATFEVNWAVVKDWSEESRYQERDRAAARDLLAAITSRKHGVLQWLRNHW